MIEFDKDIFSMTTTVKMAVVGVGGAGGNAINSLIKTELNGVSYFAVNTDLKALETSHAPEKIQIGIKSSKGLGAGAQPELGKRAAEEDIAAIMKHLSAYDLVILVGGLGGGTGSGALPIIAKALKKERDALIIAAVSTPFCFEGKRRMEIALDAEARLQQEVDTLIVIHNESLLKYDEKKSLVCAFEMVNSMIGQFVKSISDIIIKPGYINVDFADIKSVMKGKGKTLMGTGTASGENRAKNAAELAISSPLVQNLSIKGATSVLINITGNSSMGLQEINQAASHITSQVHEDAMIIVGSVIDETMDDALSVTLIATGFPTDTFAHETSENQYITQQHPLKNILSAAVSTQEVDLEIPTILRKMVQNKLQQKS